MPDLAKEFKVEVGFLYEGQKAPPLATKTQKYPIDTPLENRVKTINNGSECSVPFLSTADLFPTRRTILEHEANVILGA